MIIEPAYQADGSIGGWLLWRGDKYVGSVCRTKPARWQLNDPDGAIKGIFRTRSEAIRAAEEGKRHD